LNNILIGLDKAKVIKSSAWLVEVRLVDEVPVALEGVALALNVVSKGGALSEGVLTLLAQIRVIFLKDSELSDSSIENVRILVLEDSLCSSRDEEMGSAPESLGLGGETSECDQRCGEGVHCVGMY